MPVEINLDGEDSKGRESTEMIKPRLKSK